MSAALFTSKCYFHIIDLCLPIYNMHLYRNGGIDNRGPKAYEKIKDLVDHDGDTKHWHVVSERVMETVTWQHKK